MPSSTKSTGSHDRSLGSLLSAQRGLTSACSRRRRVKSCGAAAAEAGRWADESAFEEIAWPEGKLRKGL